MNSPDRERVKSIKSDGGDRHLPLPRGPFKVGSIDVLNGVTRDKGCLFRVFYPCRAEGHIPRDPGQKTKWLPEPEGKYADGYARTDGSLSYIAHKVLGTKNSSVYIPATTNGQSVTENRNSFPVILFSHDIGECRTTNSSLCVELASHGCVVAALEHRDNTACRTFYVERRKSFDQVDLGGGVAEEVDETMEPIKCEDEIPLCESTLDEDDEDEDEQRGEDGGPEEEFFLDSGQGGEDSVDTAAKFAVKTPGYNRTVWVNYRTIEKTPDLYNIRIRQLNRRVAECIRTLNCLERINDRRTCRNELPQNKTYLLSGLMDMSKVSVLGHGFGGSTAYMTLQMEERTVCGAAIDPLMFVIQADRPINVCRPLLIINNSRHTARCDYSIIKTMFRDTYTTAFTILGTETDAQTDLPFVKAASIWSSLSLSWPLVSPPAFTSLDLGASLVMRFMADKCNFYDREPFDEYVKRKANLMVKGVREPPRWFSKYSNAR